MANLQVFDRINAIGTANLRSIPIEKYFNEMPSLTAEQKKERIALANDWQDDIMFFFYLLLARYENVDLMALETLDAKQQLYERLHSTVSRYMDIDFTLDDYLHNYVEDMDRVTMDHIIVLIGLLGGNEEDQDKEKIESEGYYISDDRARLNGEEEANTFFNYTDFNKAKAKGYTKKQWITMRDKRVRPTHARVDSVTIPIDNYFLVGDSLMQYPRDINGSPREVIGCRCWLKFIR